MDDQIGTAAQLQLERFVVEVYRWNRRMNLTSVPEKAAWERHILQSQQLHSALGSRSAADIVDLGSGCGVPGIPLAVLRPECSVTLVESDRRKAGFLMNVAGILSLVNVTVIAERAELIAHQPAHRESYDIVVSRATAAAPTLCELALPLLRLGGVLAALVADAAGDSERCAAAARLCGGGEPRAELGVLLVDKVTTTEAGYPRAAALMRRRPL